MKRIGQLFILLFATLSFITVAFGGECDDLEQTANDHKKTYDDCKSDAYDDCMDDYNQNPAYDSDCKNEAENQCKVYRNNWESFNYEWSECLKIESSIVSAKQSCSDIAGKINRYSYSFFNAGDCCFNNHYTQPYCPETNDSGGNNELSGWLSDCPDVGVTAENVNFIHKLDDGSCCFDGGGFTPVCDDNLEQWRIECPEISEVITEESLQYINEGCCFDGGGYEPQCVCDNPPSSDGECEDGYEIDGDCCVKASCESQKDCGEGKVWSSEKCKCICDASVACCGVQLNTVVPFIGDCIELTSSTDTSQGLNQLTAFPYLMKGLSKIVVTIIMILSIIIVVVAGLMMTTSVAKAGNYETGLKWLGNVIKALILLGISGLILKLINPTFFGG